jgi:hypothetical protein
VRPFSAHIAKKEIVETPLPLSPDVSAHDIPTLLRSDDWCALESRKQLVAVFHDMQRPSAATLFQAMCLVKRSDLENHASEKSAQQLEGNFRTCDEHETAAVIAFINNGYRPDDYVAQRDVLRFVATNIGKWLTYQWMASFLKVMTM